jgi:adenine-specific DNA-methyltransferase
VEHNRAFERVAPLLWLRAGAQGRRIEHIPEDGWDVADRYGILFDCDKSAEFVDAMDEEGAVLAYIVTDDDRRFQSVAARLPDDIEPVRLYESYLTNFKLTGGEQA